MNDCLTLIYILQMGVYIHSTIIAFVYFIIKYSESRIKRINKPIDEIFKDSIIVFISTIIGLYIITLLPSENETVPIVVFTDKPNF